MKPESLRRAVKTGTYKNTSLVRLLLPYVLIKIKTNNPLLENRVFVIANRDYKPVSLDRESVDYNNHAVVFAKKITDTIARKLSFNGKGFVNSGEHIYLHDGEISTEYMKRVNLLMKMEVEGLYEPVIDS